MNPEWSRFCVALGIGLLIGLERERSKGEGPSRRPAGIRTFALASLLGAVAFDLGGAWLLAVATGGVAVLTAISHRRSHELDPGLTTEIGLVVVPLLGALAMNEPLLAAGLAAAVAVLFAAKRPLHGLVKGALTDAEVKDGLVFAIATLVIWPQLPDRAIGPFAAINPHRIWLVVVLVLTLGAAGHAATRILGRRYGLPIAGLAAGFVSSSATIGSMAGRAAQDPTSLNPAIAGSAFSTVATFVQMAILLSIVSRPTLLLLAPMLTAGAMVAAIWALAYTYFGSASASPDASENESGRAFSVPTALGLAALLAAMLILTAALKAKLGSAGLLVASTIAGVADTHAAAVSVASLVASSTLTPEESVAPILAAMSSNALAKIAITGSVGSRTFALRVVPAIALSIAAAWAVAGLTQSR
ncbi:DUF4010 domain-containing protein [Myxococcota bacterium]|nr:DUF4010 domain-containing protein [Myxococcota bacterium]